MLECKVAAILGGFQLLFQLVFDIFFGSFKFCFPTFLCRSGLVLNNRSLASSFLKALSTVLDIVLNPVSSPILANFVKFSRKS